MTEKSIWKSSPSQTDRYQAIIPCRIREILDWAYLSIITLGSSLGFIPRESVKCNNYKEEPIVDQFLSLLSQDIQENPQNVQMIDAKLVKHIQSLVADANIDLNAPLSEEDE
ncbi:type II toxin-antitoxin system PrlF family antitoxin [Spirulina sp. 06S082]|uniref:type II toxin-antitoxin system PrlF family antitoxin n=1 Tax=Spirulina sp. 06S082 TaxID=3110248 RepID=UPI002B1F90DC|nr:type II toxin-antitoxin system PrlF family antitoxin [Spirulina sp. 06S082]MEA5467318.1 type II toxin-antitoxin system PrlF family antitoxin [Spirulina sp. 06S082]